jgi:hypothetical protein
MTDPVVPNNNKTMVLKLDSTHRYNKRKFLLLSLEVQPMAPSSPFSLLGKAQLSILCLRLYGLNDQNPWSNLKTTQQYFESILILHV